MPHVPFTPNLRRHLDAPPLQVMGETVAAAFEQVFRRQPELRGYLLDDQGRLRRHVAVFVAQVLEEQRLFRDVFGVI